MGIYLKSLAMDKTNNTGHLDNIEKHTIGLRLVGKGPEINLSGRRCH